MLDSVFSRIGYPEEWLAEAARYRAADAYVAFEEQWAPGLPPIPDVRVDELLRSAARRWPERVALIELGRELTYAELDELVDRAAALFVDRGVVPGDVVAVMLPSGAAHWICFFAASRAGAVHCGVNVMYREAELAAVLADCTPRVLVHLDRFAPLVDSLAAEVCPPVRFHCGLADLAAPEFEPYEALRPLWGGDSPAHSLDLLAELRSCPPLAADIPREVRSDAAQIVYTAGTTGVSKGAVQTHFNLVHNAVSHGHVSATRGPRVNFTVLPMFHTGGFFLWALPTLALGGTVIPRPLFDPSDALSAIRRHKVSLLFGPPPLYLALLALLEREPVTLEHLEVCITGAAPVPEELPARWEAVAGVPLGVGWGMTELNTMGTYNALLNAPAPGTIGRPVLGEVKIVAENGDVLARGELGEIRFRGLQVSRGYLNKPSETREVFGADGWFATGDLGVIDEDGALRYVERKKDLIIASGFNISPAEIELALVEHPRIADAGVVGAPDPYRGETVVAFVVGEVSPEEVIAYCRERLAANKVPAHVEIVDDLPRNPIGKTLRRELRRRISEQGQGAP